MVTFIRDANEKIWLKKNSNKYEKSKGRKSRIAIKKLLVF